jgi:hypothetical protein
VLPPEVAGEVGHGDDEFHASVAAPWSRFPIWVRKKLDALWTLRNRRVEAVIEAGVAA